MKKFNFVLISPQLRVLICTVGHPGLPFIFQAKVMPIQKKIHAGGQGF